MLAYLVIHIFAILSAKIGNIIISLSDCKKKNFLFQTIILVIGQNFDRTTNFPYVDDSFIMDNYENFEEMVKTPLDRGNV